MAKSSMQIGNRRRVASRSDARPFSPVSTRQLARDIGSITSYVGAGGVAAGMQELIDDIDFPTFVADLIQGVFDAAVKASIEQMNAYAQLIKDVARAVDQFQLDNISAKQARDWLVDKYPQLIDDDEDDDDNKVLRTVRKRFTHKLGRQLAAKAALTGIKRAALAAKSRRRRR